MVIEFGFILETWEKLKYGKSSLLDTWPLYSDPLAISLILVAYITIVLHIGPKWMENRKAYNLKHVIIAYNALQVCFNAYVLFETFVEPLFWKYLFSFGCAQVTQQEEQHYNKLVCRAFWFMTINKILDLLDTVFFILCKKQNHITFLHVQHHVLSLAILWAGGKYFTGQEFTMTFFCNTIVHTIMYFYYFLAALGPAYKKYLWWKKYLTLMQIAQFIIIISYMIPSLWFSCGYDARIIWLLIGNVFVNLILFLNFYLNTYNSKKLLSDKVAVCGSLQFNNDYNEESRSKNVDKNSIYKKGM